MARYSVFGDKGSDNVLQILGYNNTATLPRRTKLYDWTVGNSATPADAVFNHQLLRATADPTATGVTPTPLDPADAPSLMAGSDTVTTDAAGTVLLADFSLNHRATYRWVSAPGSELVTAATDNLGIFSRVSAATTSTFHATMMVDEQ